MFAHYSLLICYTDTLIGCITPDILLRKMSKTSKQSKHTQICAKVWKIQPEQLFIKLIAAWIPACVLISVAATSVSPFSFSLPLNAFSQSNPSRKGHVTCLRLMPASGLTWSVVMWRGVKVGHTSNRHTCQDWTDWAGVWMEKKAEKKGSRTKRRVRMKQRDWKRREENYEAERREEE